MRKRFYQLSFVIGLFFSLVAVVLLLGYLLSSNMASALNLYTGIVFLIFGLFMLLTRDNESDNPGS